MSDLQLNAQDEVLLESLVLAASDNVTRAESEDRGEYAPTRRRVYEEIDTGNVYLGTGDAWVDVSEATGLVSSLFQGGDINVADVDADSVNAINAGVKSLSTEKALLNTEGPLTDPDGVLSTLRSVDPTSAANRPVGRTQAEDGVDVWVVGGQSNAVGAGGDTASAPTPPANARAYRNGQLEDFTGSLHGSAGGAWAAFSVAYESVTGRPAVYVPTAVSSSAQDSLADDGDGVWDPGHSSGLLADSIQAAKDAMAALEANGENPVFRGVQWHQGEDDARSIDAGDLDVHDYAGSLISMIQEYLGELGGDFYIYNLGHETSGDTAGYKAVRNAQTAVAAEYGRVHLAFDRCQLFPDQGRMGDGIHFSQDAYNEMGRVGGRVAARHVEGDPYVAAKRGDSDQLSGFTPAPGELVQESESGSVAVGDGETPGGRPTNPELVAFASSDQTVDSGELLTVVLDDSDVDDFPGEPLETSNGKVTIPSDGRYELSGVVTWSNVTADAWHRARIEMRGSVDDTAAGNISYAPVAGFYLTCQITGRSYELEAGDEVYLTADHNAASGEQVYGGLEWTFFRVRKVV